MYPPAHTYRSSKRRVLRTLTLAKLLTAKGTGMRYVYAMAGALQRKPKVGNGDCVALVQHYANAPNTRRWKQGAAVLDGKDIAPGTVIATFVNGRYPNRKTGNHAAFFLRHSAPGQGFYVIDQWLPKSGQGEKPYISSRLIYSKQRKQNADGSWPEASDNADAFSVVE